MTPEKVIEAARAFAALARGALERHQYIKPHCVDLHKVNPTRIERVQHLFFTFAEIERLAMSGKTYAAKRLLDFAHGVIWVMFPISRESLENINPLMEA